MRAGKKPLAMFCDSVPASYDMPEADFAPDVAAGSIVRREETYRRPDAGLPIRFVYFALTGEEWRIEAMHRLNWAIFVAGHLATAADEREIGRLLGYAEEDIERYLALVRGKGISRE